VQPSRVAEIDGHSYHPVMDAKEKGVAAVTGANRGIGLEVCRQLARLGWRVVLTGRDEGRAREAARELAADGGWVTSRQLDVTDGGSVAAFREWLGRELGRLDVLVNNAAVYPDEGVPGLTVDIDTVRATLDTNTIGPLRLCQALVPLMVSHRYGRIVNVTSGYGQADAMTSRTLAYKISKLALNGITRILADELRGSGVLVNAVDPGWVRTDMGGPGATRSVAQGADTVVFLATLPEGGPTGRLYRDRRVIPW
jgi:NAD(P)-dependent dehydrogenase (short-subunit alcohol dehydrogenase family)